jgi:hypothetical protein
MWFEGRTRGHAKREFQKKDGGAMNTAASWFDPILAHLEAADPPQVWRLLYFARAASVSLTAARATLLIIVFHLHGLVCEHSGH